METKQTQTIDIRHEQDHYVVYVDGEFFCSADTYIEGVYELRDAGIL